jgi:hypothetical protein
MWIFLLLIIFIYIYALLGMSIFGGALDFEGSPTRMGKFKETKIKINIYKINFNFTLVFFF